MSNIKKINSKKFTWFDVAHADHNDLKYLKTQFNFDSSDLNDCLPERQRQKIHIRPNYIFMVLQFPLYNRETKSIEASEVDLFISKKYLITLHEDDLPPLVDLFRMAQTEPLAQSQMRNEDVMHLVKHLFYKLYIYCYPILNHINLDINHIEKDILEMPEEKTVKNILIIKRNIVNYQKTMQSHRGILQKLKEATYNWRGKKTDNDYNGLISHTREIWDYLNNYKDTINALHETQESMTSLKINEIMKTLTIFSVVVFPLTLLAAIFGMNTMNSMPFTDNKYDFWYIIGIMAVGMKVMFGFFKKKKWL